MDEFKTLTKPEEVKAISDPMKYRILTSLYHFAEPATVKQIADHINEVPSKVHYHVKKMESLGILKLMFTKEIKGIIAKYYEPTAETFHINCSDEVTNQNKKLIIAESQRTLGRLYDSSKNSFLEQMQRLSDKDKKTGTVIMSELHLSDDEAKEFSNYVKAFFKKHENKENANENTHKHQCFVSIFEIIED